MTTYRMMFGIHPLSLFIAPLVFDKHPEELPRFNDLIPLAKDDGYCVKIISRIGKKYYGQDMGEEYYLNHPNFIKFEDKLYTKYNDRPLIDDSYGNYFFSIPEKYKEDIELMIKTKKVYNISEEAKEKIIDTYPKIEERLKLILNDPDN